jgi:hypothetical protein
MTATARTTITPRVNGHAPVPPLGEPTLVRHGLDLALLWSAAEVRFTLHSVREGRDGVRGELGVFLGGRRLSWGMHPLSNISAREALRRKLGDLSPGQRWGEFLEDGCWRFTRAVRDGDPTETLTGKPTSVTRELLPNFLYEGEPTLLFGDGDTGKSLVAVTLAVAVQSGVGLPFGLRPTRAVPAAILDWETTRDPVDARAGMAAAGLGVDVPPILYKRMARPLADQAGALAGEFAERGVGFIVIDSMMFAVGGSDGVMVHEPITQFYNALRLFGSAAILVLSHVTGADARGTGPKRPYGGAFAFNGPRLIWEASRDREVSDATAIAFTCRKSNNFARRPDPFGLKFQPGDGTVTVHPFDLTEAAPETLAGNSLSGRIRAALASGAKTVAELGTELGAPQESVRKALQRGRDKFFILLEGNRWGLVQR